MIRQTVSQMMEPEALRSPVGSEMDMIVAKMMSMRSLPYTAFRPK